MLKRHFAKWALAAFTSVAFGAIAAEPASAHFPRLGFRHCYGGYYGGFHGGYHGGYHGWGNYGFVSSYRVSPWCFAPRVVRYNYYAPVVTWPISTYYVAPTYQVAPTYYVDPCAPTWGGVSYEVGTPFASTRGPRDFLSDGSTVTTASASASVPKWGSSPTTMYVAAKPRVLQPYSPIWTKAAVGIVDEMIEKGRFDDAQASCSSMEKIQQPKGAGVYLRQGLIKYFATEDHTLASTDQVLRLLEQACEAGSQLSAEELNCQSLREYFAACAIDLDATLESLSRTVLENPENSEREILLLTVLLKLEGQTERAQLFAREAGQLAARSGKSQWNNVLSMCSQ